MDQKHVNFLVNDQGAKTVNNCHVMERDNCSVVFHPVSEIIYIL